MIYSFAGFRLDVDRRELHCDEALINLRPKVFDLLILLIELRDRVVSKDELLDQVWSGRYISETTLSSCLKELRKTLGDSGKQQAIIRTIHGKGFRFVAVLEDQATQELPQKAAQEPAQETAAIVPESPTITTAASTITPESERKNVTVLRCGLVSASELAEQLGPEAMHYLLQDLFALTQEIVSRFDGQVSQWLSDGFVALFGVPTAHEDHARRALLAAFELSKRSCCLNQQQQPLISFGLASGTAIISRLPGNPEQFYTPLSSISLQSETLQSQAEAGRVLISTDSYRLLRADVRVQAVDENDNAWLVEHIVAQRAGVPRRFRRHMAPLIGRNQELNLLQQKLLQAEEGHGQAVAVIGNPGIGKSRLLSEFRQYLDKQKVRYLEANCFPHFSGTPYYPLVEYLRQCCDIDNEDSDSVVQDKLRYCLEQADLTHAEALALLLRLLELPHDNTALEQFSAQAQRDKTAFYLQRLLLHRKQTTVIVLEDLHWLDASSQSWLNAFVSQLVNQPVLFIASSRPGTNPEWLQLPWVSQLALSQLTQEHCIRLLCSLPRAAALQNRLLELATLSGGNPFFLEELAINSTSAISDKSSVPDTVQGVLAARIDQLEPNAKKLLHAAAIIGLSGPLALLESVSNMDAEQMDRTLLCLQSTELLFTDFAGSEQIFTFKHALIQEVAYNNQLGDQRQSMHEHIAITLHSDFTEFCAHRPEFLAHHYNEAGRYEDAVLYWQRAGRKAYESSAYIETIDYVRRGLALLPQFENQMARTKSELALHRTLGPALMTTHGYGAAEVEQTWTRAKQLCEELQDNSSLFRVLIGLSNYYWVSGNFSKAFDCNRQLLRLARRANNNSFMLRAKAAMGELMLHSGRVRSAKRYLEQCMTLIENDPQPVLSTQVSAVAATCYAAWLNWHLGQEAVALDYAEQALQRARVLERPFTLAIALHLTADLHRFRGDARRALELAQEGAAISEEQDFPFWHGSALVTLGWAEACIGDPAKGIATIQQGLSVFRATGATVQLPSWLGALADAYRITGQMDTAQSTIDEALNWARQTGDCYYVPQLLELQNRLGLHQQNISVTTQRFESSRINCDCMKHQINTLQIPC